MLVCKTVRTCSRLFTQVFVSLKWFASVCKAARVCDLTWFCVHALLGFGVGLLFSGTCWFLLRWLTVRKSGNRIMTLRQAAFWSLNSFISWHLWDSHEYRLIIYIVLWASDQMSINVFHNSAKHVVFCGYKCYICLAVKSRDTVLCLSEIQCYQCF